MGTPEATADALATIRAAVITCQRCPRLVAWREEAARNPPRRYAGQVYWQRPVPGFGDPAAHLLIVGLAPAAHGGNRTGRVFTGDRSGDFLFAALHATGYANQATSVSADDGLRLRGAYIAAVNRCCPPGNKPTPAERDACLPFLVRELEVLTKVRVILALGAFAWDGVLRSLAGLDHRPSDSGRPVFGHGAEVSVGPYRLVGCFHPSQQNTFTGRLTPEMLEQVLGAARRAADGD